MAELARMAAAAGAGEVLCSSDADSGDFERDPFVFAPAFRNGEPVRLTTGGVPVREGGLLGRLIDGLSQEEKKSSSGSPAGVFAPSDGVPAGTSVITTSSGCLDDGQHRPVLDASVAFNGPLTVARRMQPSA